MPLLQRGRPVDSDAPRLVVHHTLPPGRHRFELVVVDDRGRVSAPDVWIVTVLPHPPGRNPPPAIDPRPKP